MDEQLVQKIIDAEQAGQESGRDLPGSRELTSRNISASFNNSRKKFLNGNENHRVQKREKRSSWDAFADPILQQMRYLADFKTRYTTIIAKIAKSNIPISNLPSVLLSILMTCWTSAATISVCVLG